MATLVLVGPPNAGKSTLFNVLTKSRAALVADYAGVTRDPLVGQMQLGGQQVINLIDTGGFAGAGDSLSKLVNQRIVAMLHEADMVLVVVEKAAQPSADMQQLVKQIRLLNKPLLLLLNKSDKARASDTTEWYRLHPQLLEISAVHRHGIAALHKQIISAIDNQTGSDTEPDKDSDQTAHAPRLVVAGRPNVGKSTLVNFLLGENRLITSDIAGTTRDVIAFPLQRAGQSFTLLDTPGVRRWGRIHQTLEKFSILKGMEALRQCDAAILLIDGDAGLLEQDLRLLGRFRSIAPATIIGINKIDKLHPETKARLNSQLSRRDPALAHYPLVHFSAHQGKGVNQLLRQALKAAKAAQQNFATSVLVRTLEQAIAKQQPATNGRFRPRLKFIHQVTPKRRLTFRISGTQATRLHPSYIAYLANTLTQRFALTGVNFDLDFVDSKNPYGKA